MPFDDERPDRRRPSDHQDDSLWDAAWSRPDGPSLPPDPHAPATLNGRSSLGARRTAPREPGPQQPGSEEPRPVAERRVYRAGGNDDEGPGGARVRRARGSRGTGPESGRAGRLGRRSPILAVVVLVAIVIIVILVGVAARGSGLGGSQSDLGTFKLLPLTTTTTS
jgi:hypothetical protein